MAVAIKARTARATLQVDARERFRMRSSYGTGGKGEGSRLAARIASTMCRTS
jgi:hypothetical protein